jgi:hypothetical protein
MHQRSYESDRVALGGIQAKEKQARGEPGIIAVDTQFDRSFGQVGLDDRSGRVGIVEICLRPFQIVLKRVGEGVIYMNDSEFVGDLERYRIVRFGIVLLQSV